MKKFNEKQKISLGIGWSSLILFFLLCDNIQAQEKHSVQIKTFDQQLSPYTNIEVAINNHEYVAINAKGIAFTELSDADLPIKTIKVKNDQLKAASWNYSKGTLEIIVRRKNYQIA